jgi:hypothetical protein
MPPLLTHEWRLTLPYLARGFPLSFCDNTAAPPSGKSPSSQDTQPKGPELMLANSPQTMYGATDASQATVFYYQDPRTGQRVASLLPPDHPQMVCLQSGEHVAETRYGFLGALCLRALFIDRVWTHVNVLYISRRACGDCMVPTWYRPVSA